MSKQLKLKYNDGYFLVRDADILLFRAPKTFTRLGWWIAKWGGTPYSHCALANWEDGFLHCLEFREFVGSRNYRLSHYINSGWEIDVFRVPLVIKLPYISDYLEFRGRVEYTTKYRELKFDKAVTRNIIQEAKNLIGKPYGWKVIYNIAKTFVPFWRFIIEKDHPENGRDLFVCSTLVTYAYRKHFTDLCPLISDDYTQPSDIARSALLNYLFTLTQ